MTPNSKNYTRNTCFVSNDIFLIFIFTCTRSPGWINVTARQLLRQHYTAQYPDDSARNRYPTLMLKVTVPPSSVDVNLTPDKTQVLLQDKVAIKPEPG